jgi:hypothetical protein
LISFNGEMTRLGPAAKEGVLVESLCEKRIHKPSICALHSIFGYLLLVEKKTMTFMGLATAMEPVPDIGRLLPCLWADLSRHGGLDG